MQSHHKHHGFSFAEVMFAVVILGIGFILIAAIFPVAVQQTQSNNDDAFAAQLARDAVKLIIANTTADQYSIGQLNACPFTQLPSPLWDQIGSATICPSDPRYAWVPYWYRLDEQTIQITVVVVRRTVFSRYLASDTNSTNGELVPRNLTVLSAATGNDGTSTITFSKVSGYAALAPGAFVVMTSGSNLAGKAFRLGDEKSETAGAETWSIQLTDDVTANDFTSTFAAVTGRDCVDSLASIPVYIGPAQEVAVYTTFFHPS